MDKLSGKKIKISVISCLILILLAGLISAVPMLMSFEPSMDFDIAMFLIMLVITSFLLIVYYFYLVQDQPENRVLPTVGFSILFICYLICTVLMSRLNITCIPFLLCSLLMVSIMDKKQAVLGNATLAFLLLLAYIVNVKFSQADFDMESVLTLLVNMCGGWMVVYLVNQQHNRIKIIGIAFAISIVVAVFSVLAGIISTTVVTDLLLKGAWSLAGSVGSILLFFLFLPIFEWVFKLNTNLQLMEYLSFDKELLKELAEKAPGTFNHSLEVGNLAERCAYAIGENVNLAKAAAYYHDVGKLQNPEFFAENQTDGYNPHDDLAFETSVSLITRHTEAGYKMLKEKAFPPEIVNVCREHHGTSKLQYFYVRAQNITEGTVDGESYSYQGPKPSSKISAIIMICDTVEAATRASGTRDEQALKALIEKLVKTKLDEGQFDDCDITMKELSTIVDTLVACTMGSQHTRIKYPERKK